jgi:hypothetical protein
LLQLPYVIKAEHYRRVKALDSKSVGAFSEVLMIYRFACAFLIATSAAGPLLAADATIGGQYLKLPSPKGYCELSEQKPSDVEMIQTITRLLKTGGNQLLGMSAECNQLNAWQGNPRKVLDDYTQYQTPIRASTAIARPENLKQICNATREQAANIISSNLSEFKKQYEDVKKNIQLNSALSLGVLDEDPHTCYTGVLSTVKTQIGTEKIQLALNAITLVKSKIIFYIRFTVAQNADTPSIALRQHKVDVGALLAANRQ